MSDTTVPSDVTANDGVTDEQFNEYFKSRGEKAPFKEEVPEPKDEAVEIVAPKSEKPSKSVKTEQEKVEKPQKEEETKPKNDEAENNYKRMAHEERQRRQELKQELETLRREQEQLRQYLHEQNLRQQQAQQPQPPSYDENPLDNLHYRLQQQQQILQQQQQAFQQQEYEQRLKRGEEEFKKDYREKLLSFGKENNVDIEGVYKYLTEYKQKEYMARGLSEQEARQELIKEELSVVARAYNQGVNPGQLIYNVAQALGYQRQPTQAQAPEVEPSVELLSQANEKLANIEKGIAASRSLGSSNANPPSSLTLSQIANLPPDEFAKYTSDPKNWERINQKLASR